VTLNRSIVDKRFILGSGSPRRLELLAQIGIKPDLIKPAGIDEAFKKLELPKNYCIRMARQKAEAILIEDSDVLLTADTTVSVGRKIIGKPQNKDQAREYLLMLSGRRHKVTTAVAVKYQNTYLERSVVSTVKMKRITNIDIEAYLSEGEWQGKAGGYGLQGAAAVFIPWIQGSYSAIIGLPLAETAALLNSVGIRSS
jgi:septum formation protein